MPAEEDGEWQKEEKAAEEDLFEQPEHDLDDLLVELNEMTADALGLTKEERRLVSDLVQVRYALNDGKRGEAAMREPKPKELTAYAKRSKTSWTTLPVILRGARTRSQWLRMWSQAPP